MICELLEFCVLVCVIFDVVVEVECSEFLLMLRLGFVDWGFMFDFCVMECLVEFIDLCCFKDSEGIWLCVEVIVFCLRVFYVYSYVGFLFVVV